MPQVAFFPWIDLEDDLNIGSYSLKRFRPGSLPSVDEDLRATLDSVLAPYRDTADRPVGSAVIVSTDRGVTDALSAEDRDDLFCFAELFAFAALAMREFFTQDYYFNRDYLRLVVQGFADPKGDVVVVTRGRDGGTTLMTPRICYRVQAPDHVTRPGLPIKPDRALLHALLASREHEAWSRLYQGIVLFNQAEHRRAGHVAGHGAGADVRGDGTDSEDLVSLGSETIPGEVRRGMAPDPRGASERMARATDRKGVDEGQPSGLLGVRSRGLSRELGAR